MNARESNEQYVTAADLARMLKCGKSTIYTMAKAGRIPRLSLGAKGVRFDRKAVLEAMGR